MKKWHLLIYVFLAGVIALLSAKLQAEPWIPPVSEIAAVAVIAMLAIIALYSRIYPWILGFFTLQLDIQDFDKGATELDIGKGLKAMVEESYNRIGSQMGHPRVYLIDGPPGTPQIPVDIKVAPYLKIISDLIEWVFPQKVITLSGYLQKPGKLGAGLTLTLVNNRTGEIVANHTIWQKDFDPTVTQQANSGLKDPTPYYRLTEPAAIWTLFHLGKQIERYEFALLGTQNWLSFAYFRAGALWTLEGDKIKARQLYVEALSQDINNRSVLFNLGYLDIEDRNYDRAIERLSEAKELSKPNDPLELPKDPVWYLATYQLAAAYHYKSILFQTKKDLDQAETESLDLVEKISATISELQSSLEAREKELKQFLESIEPNATIMHASILVDQGKIAEAELKVNNIKREYSKLTYRVHYNLACYYSIVGHKTNSPNAYKQALYHLEYSLERGGDIIKWAQNDPSLKAVSTEDNFAKLIKKYATQ